MVSQKCQQQTTSDKVKGLTWVLYLDLDYVTYIETSPSIGQVAGFIGINRHLLTIISNCNV